jgi:4-amino-4-deoxy-L-arabinose transferase-like glycosyltransferase
MTDAPLSPSEAHSPAADEQAAASRPAVGRVALTLLRRHWPILVACGLAFALRAVLIAIIHSQATSDSLFYMQAAKAIAEGQGYSINGHPTAFFPVGWPAFIAFVFKVSGSESFAVVLWAGAVLWSISTALVYVFTLRLGGRAAAIVAACVMAVYPDFLFYSLRAVSEALFIPLLLGMCIALTPPSGSRLSTRRAALAGALLGAAILVRSTAALVPFVVAILLVLAYRDGKALRTAVVFALIAYLVVAPWVVRNQAVMKTLALSTNGGFTLWLGDNPRATGSNQLKSGAHPHWAISTAAAEVADNRLRTQESLHFIVHDFRQWVALIPAKFRYLFQWTPGTLERSLEQATNNPEAIPPPRALTPTEARLVHELQRLYSVFRTLNTVWWWLAAVAAVAAVVRRRPGAALVAVIVGFWVLMHVTVVHGQFRYMLSVQPLLMAPLGWAVVAAITTVWSRLARVSRARA